MVKQFGNFIESLGKLRRGNKYEAIKSCGSVQEVRTKGGSAWDLADYYKKGKVRVLEAVRPKSVKGWGKGDGVALEPG